MRPTLRHLRLLITWTLLGLANALVSLWPNSSLGVESLLFNSWLASGGILLALTCIDFLLLRQAKHQVSLSRTIAPNLPVGEWTNVIIDINHHYKRQTSVELFDHHPPDAEIEGLPMTVLLAPGQTSQVQYAVRPTIRGDATFNPIQVLHHTFLNLWQRNYPGGNHEQIKVYPNFASMHHYNLLAVDNHVSQLGIKLKQRRGEGLEFHQLRNYRPGDSLRQIDWKASSRQKKFISKEYQDERDQQIIILLDCGRRMRSQDDDLSHFDHALNSILLLSYVALRQGDAVGLMSFGGTINSISSNDITTKSKTSSHHRWLSPIKSTSGINTILNQVYDLHASTQASDYSSAAKELMNRQRKRSLVIMVSNVRDENIDDLLPAIKLLRQRHLVLLANMREDSLDKSLNKPITNFKTALRYVGTLDYLDKRKHIHDKLQEHNVIAIDCTPRQLPSLLINQYYEIKRGGLL